MIGYRVNDASFEAEGQELMVRNVGDTGAHFSVDFVVRGEEAALRRRGLISLQFTATYFGQRTAALAEALDASPSWTAPMWWISSMAEDEL